MPIHFRCTHCRAHLSITRRKAGKTTTCPRCGQEVRVPEVDSNPTRSLAERPSPGGGSAQALQTDQGEGGASGASPSLSGKGRSLSPLELLPLEPLSSPPPRESPPLRPAGIAPAPIPPPLPVTPQVAAVPQAPLASVPPPLPARVVVPPPPSGAGGPPVPPPHSRDIKPAARSGEKAAKSRSVRSAPADNEPPLFERDIDSLLGPIQNTQPFRKSRSQPATGMDAAMILDNRGPPSEYVQRLTSVVVIAFTLVVLAFLAGLFIATR